MNSLYLLRRSIGVLAATAAFVCFGFAPALAQNADLSILKLGPSGLKAGTNVSYTVIVSNVSDAEDSTPANTVTNTLPPGLTFVSATTEAGWNCSTPAVGATGAITCIYDNPIGVDQSFSFTFVFHVDSHAAPHFQVCDTATISHDGTDSNPENNRATACGTVGDPPFASLTPHDVLISEFRLSGPNGNNDDFIELYCNRATACDLSGASLRAYDPNLGSDFTYSFPAKTVIAARQYLLVGDSGGYSLSRYGTLDFDVHTEKVGDFFIDNEGIQILTAEEGLVLDSVGFAGGGNDFQYVEGIGLQPGSARPPGQYSYVRKRGMKPNGPLQDTDDNTNDFVLVSISGGLHPEVTEPPVSGAPGPQEQSPNGTSGRSPTEVVPGSPLTAKANQPRRPVTRALPRHKRGGK